jgi:AcrR family transcriptional regulator
MPKQKKSAKSAYHHGSLRQALVSEAVALIREAGEDALSMRALATRVDVSRTAAYHHFKGKEDLLCAIAEEGFERILAESRTAELESQAEVGEEQIKQLISNYLNFAVENAEYYNLMFGSRLWKSSVVTDQLTAKAHEFFRFHVSVLRERQIKGQICQSIDIVRHSQVTMSTLHGMSRLLIDGIYVDKATIASIGDAAARMFWRELQGE